MKPRKTRIKKIVRKDGTVIYKAQDKRFLFWNEWGEGEFDTLEPITPLNAWGRSCGDYMSKDIEKVKLLIDDYILMFNEEVQRRERSKTVKTEYIDYP